MKTLPLALASSALFAVPAMAQDHSAHTGHAPQAQEAPVADHSGMDHSQMDHSTHAAMDDASMPMGHQMVPSINIGSGTARLPSNEGMMPGVHFETGDWMLMTHGFASAQYTDHSGPRGDDQFYVTTMAMLMGERDTSWGRIQLKSMMSLEPLMDARGYPNLFATGETADGEPLVDRQHPHDLFMELAARVDFDVTDDGSIFLYGGPVGEPALGPSAFMHRGSAALNPEPPITHHWFDSTHITYGVATLGWASSKGQLEVSAFRGAEPDEDRWDIETPKLDSWSIRGTLTPTPNWVLQASYGDITEPEAIHPGEDERRFTASAHYADLSGFSAMLAFSSKKHVEAHDDAMDADHEEEGALTAWLAEANYDLDDANTVFARFENVANDELFPDHEDPLHDQRFRVSKFQAGYARRIPLGDFQLALGGSASFYAKPEALDAAYGKNPWGYTVFARLSLGN